MKLGIRFPACVLTLALISAGPGGAGGNKKTTQDEDFVHKAIASGIMEVKISEHAEKHGEREEVKSLAQHLAKDHARLNKDLLEKAKNLKQAVLVGLEKERKEKIDRLTKLQGADLDREYMKQVVDGHQASIKLYEIQAQSGADADLKSFARDTLPALREHLKKAQSVAEKLKN